MADITVIDNKYAKLEYHTDTKIVHHTFHESLDTEHMKLVLNTGIDLLKQHHAVKWLSDNRALNPHSEEDGTWVNNDWLPRVIAAGWKFWALVVPDDVRGRMNMAEFVDMFYAKGVRIMVFSKFDEAMHWLENVDQA
ncbi:MAG: hypothetical protein H7X77_00205 [Anaerolineae bacterium]|nr:hypothetical protein [Anaerolineae bacterium]